jgi:hypothetical protein
MAVIRTIVVCRLFCYLFSPIKYYFPLRLFNRTDDHDIANILYRPIFSGQVWLHILRLFTAFLAVILIFVHASNVEMAYHPYALVSAAGCVSTLSVRLIHSQVKQTELLPDGNDRKRRRFSWTGEDSRKATERYQRRVVRPLLTDFIW